MPSLLPPPLPVDIKPLVLSSEASADFVKEHLAFAAHYVSKPAPKDAAAWINKHSSNEGVYEGLCGHSVVELAAMRYILGIAHGKTITFTRMGHLSTPRVPKDATEQRIHKFFFETCAAYNLPQHKLERRHYHDQMAAMCLNLLVPSLQVLRCKELDLPAGTSIVMNRRSAFFCSLLLFRSRATRTFRTSRLLPPVRVCRTNRSTVSVLFIRFSKEIQSHSRQASNS